MKIYTKTGDQGKTSLFDGSRVGKSTRRIDLLGHLDELNSHLGLLRSHLSPVHPQSEFIHEVQSTIFDIGSEIANPGVKRGEYLDLSDTIARIESSMDAMDQNLDTLRNFILPGGTKEASLSHICRTVARRCERMFFRLSEEIELNPSIGMLLNRLSDYFFVLARYLNAESKVNDIVWNKKPDVTPEV